MSSSRDLCVICLRIDRKLRRIPAALSDYHDEIADFLVEVMSPKYCSECEHLLRKTYNFHKRCKASANILNKWMKTKAKSRSPIDELQLKLPSRHLSMWTPENTKVITYTYSDEPEQVIIKEELDEENVHDEIIFKMEVHCESDQSIQVLESLLQDSNEVGNTEHLNENKLTIDNTIPNDFTSDSVLNDSETVDHPKLTNANEMPMSNDTQILLNMSNTTDDLSILTDDTTIITNDIPIGITSNAFNNEQNTSDDEDLICVHDEHNNEVILLDDDDDDDEMLDDVSLNSDDDCDDYLIPPSPPRKKPKVKMTLDQIANITLSDDDFDDNYLRDIQKTTKTSKNSQSLDTVLFTEKEIEKKLETINESLKNLCENWEIPCLQEMGEPNVTNDDIKEVTRQLLVEKKPVISKTVVKRGVRCKLTHIIADLDTINNQCLEIIEDYKVEKQIPKERLKLELQKKFELWGEVTTEDGFVLDKDVILNSIDVTHERTVKNLLRRLRDSKKPDPPTARLLKVMQKKHIDSQYTTVFNIEYMTTEKEMVEEFERRKTYECYVTAEYKCETCYQGFKFQRLLDYHNKSHDVSAGSFECRICHIRFPSKEKMKRHLIHYAVYRCKMCPLVTYYRSSMVNHYEQHNGTIYQCKLCDATLKSKSVYLQHQSSMHPRGVNVCTFCGGAFISPLGLKLHIKKKHNGEVPTESAEGVTCDKCSLTFPSLEAFNKHDKLHGAKRDRVLYETHQSRPYKKRGPLRIPRRPRKTPIMICKVCNAVGHNYGWMKHHLRTEHPGMNRDLMYADKHQFLCDVCGKGFSYKYNLRDHMDVHSGITYPCEKCPKRYPSRASLRLHELTHNPTGFCCERCGRKYNSKSNLYNHMRSHIRDRRFKCSICDKGFIHSFALTAHIRRVHDHVRQTRKRRQGVRKTGEKGVSEAEVEGVSEAGVQEVSEAGVQEVSESELEIEEVCMTDSD